MLTTLLVSGMLASSLTVAQINPLLLRQRWPALWITHATASTKNYGVFHFRKRFALVHKPERFVVHVSADNRYRLFVNGQFVCHGPARGDLAHWRFESVDLAPYLNSGENVIAAVVWNFAEHMPWAQITHETAFLLQGNTEAEALVNTNRSWSVIQNEAYAPLPVDGRALQAFIVVGPGDKVEAAKYPWGWEREDFDDRHWQGARALESGTPREMRDGGSHWMLTPRTIPLLDERLERIPTLARASGIAAEKDFLAGKKPLPIPARSAVTLLLDQTHLTTAYPELLVSRGKGSVIKIIYAEALVDSLRNKGQRDIIAGREILGYHDEFYPDGGMQRKFRPLWFRTYRFVQLEIQTAGEELLLHDFYGMFTGYPFAEQAKFESNEPSLQNIWNVGWRTARLCAGETYYDCPYYEQLQYVGDTRIQALISLYVSGDDRLMRNAMQQFDDSRIPDGLTASRYPSAVVQIIPPYSLFWIAMIHDYWRHRSDDAFVQSFLPGIRNVIAWYERYIDATGMLGPMPWWNFADWLDEWPMGVPPGAEDGHSALITLQFIYNLEYAAQLAEAYQQNAEATHYRMLVQKLKLAMQKTCWEESRGLFADTPEKKTFSEHVNVMAVLVNLIPAEQQKSFMEKLLAEQSLARGTFYYRFYLHQALQQAGMGERYLAMLGPWHDMLKLGLTTFAEKPEPTRSDCHAWSASPNYDLLATVCGITPDTPGFATVRIAPQLGALQWINARMPHPRGEIVVALRRYGSNSVQGEVTLPEGVTGKFVWQGKTVTLKSGKQSVAP